MRSFSLMGSLAIVLLAGTAVPALAANATSTNSSPEAVQAQTVVAGESSPAGMQARSRRSDDADDVESPSDDADAQGQPDNDVDRGPYADRGSDSVAPGDDYGPDDRGYRSSPESGPDNDAPREGYEDGDRGDQSDEDDDDQDDDSDFHWA